MVCSNCKKEVPGNSKHCPYCGAAVVNYGNQMGQGNGYGAGQYPGGTMGQGNGYGAGQYPGGMMGQNNQGGPGLAIASMVCGICSILFCCCFYYVSLVLAIVGLVLGAVSVYKKNRGKGMAIAGIVMSIVSLLFAVLLLVTAGAIMSSLGINDLLSGLR